MAKGFSSLDLSKLERLGDDKALALAAYGASVSAYRYIVLSEKARDPALRAHFEKLAGEERAHRDRLQALLRAVSGGADGGGFYLSSEDKSAVCVGPRLVDARDDARFDEAMRLVIASEKRTASFYGRYAAFARNATVKTLFLELAAGGLDHVRRLRDIFRQAGKQISEPCPLVQLK